MNTTKRSVTIDDLYNIAYIEDPRISPDGHYIAYVQRTVDRLENGYKTNIWIAPTDGKEPFQLTRGDKDFYPRWSPDGNTLAFVSSRKEEKPQIFLLPINMPGGEARQLTEHITGAFAPDWSPDGKQIAYLVRLNATERANEDSGEKFEKPQSKFELEQMIAQKKHEEKLRFEPRLMWRIPYREGTAFVDDRFTQIHIVDVEESSETEPRRLTDIDANYEPPKWALDGQSVYSSRPFDPLADEYAFQRKTLYKVNINDGTETQLTDKSHNDFLPTPSPDGNWIAYIRSMFATTDKLIKLALISTDEGDVTDLNIELDREPTDFKWAHDSSHLVATFGNWGDGEIYQISIPDGEVAKIISGRMEAEVLDISVDGGVTFVATTPTSPPELFWQPPGADEPLQLSDANTDFLNEVMIQETHEMIFTNPDGYEIQGWYILPVSYEEGKTYPLAFNIHGGPHAMWGPSAKTMFHEWQSHAARGYVVFYCNPRGSSGYGEKHKSDLHAAWGEVAYIDLMAGIEALLEKGFVDESRMAVTGGSYGGYMTGWIVGHTDRFVCAVPQRGVYNLSSFYGTSDIPFLITGEYDVEPWEDHDLLWKHSPLAYAHKVKTPTLIIHAENDFRVPIEQAEQFFAFIRRATDTPVEMWRYPRDGHELSRSGEPRHRVSRLTKMIDWFDKYCLTE